MQNFVRTVSPTNPQWARVVAYGSFFLCVIHKDGLCPSSGDINRLTMKDRIPGLVWFGEIPKSGPRITPNMSKKGDR
jgi:hypothetical protein